MAVGEGGGAVSGGSSQVRERSSGRQYIGGSETRHGKHFPLSLFTPFIPSWFQVVLVKTLLFRGPEKNPLVIGKLEAAGGYEFQIELWPARAFLPPFFEGF